MHKYLSYPLVVMALVSACGNNNTSTTLLPQNTEQLDPLLQYEDYNASFSQDGSRGAFISRRSDDKTPHVYLYSAAAPLVSLDDTLKLPLAGSQEPLASLSLTGKWVVTSRTDATSAQVLVSSFPGTSQASVAIAADHVVTSLDFAKGSDDYFAFVERNGNTKTVHVEQVTGDDTSVTVTEIGNFADQDQPRLFFADGQLRLFTVSSAAAALVSQPVVLQNYTGTAGSWTTTSDGSLKINPNVLAQPFLVNKAGLFTSEVVAAPRIRNMLGNGPTAGIVVPTVATIEDLQQQDVYQAALPYDFTNAAYRTAEATTVDSVSGTVDGAYLNISGLDSFYCVIAQHQIPVQKLIRRSDMKQITWMLSRRITSPVSAWTEVATDPCTTYETPVNGLVGEIDLTAAHADLISVNGTEVIYSIVSFYRGDGEIRLVKFTPDFDAGTVSGVTVVSVSANERP